MRVIVLILIIALEEKKWTLSLEFSRARKIVKDTVCRPPARTSFLVTP
jgi:hypothetical protein